MAQDLLTRPRGAAPEGRDVGLFNPTQEGRDM